jgi:hypothetical protein
VKEDEEMSEISNESNTLLTKIRAKRRELSAYLSQIEPRNSRLINFSIIAGALAAGLTAGPGIGGDGFIGAAKGIISFGIPVWQVLCLIATTLSIIVVISNGMLKSHDITTKIGQARMGDAKLEGLETLLELEQIDVKQAAQRYSQYLTEIPHI